MSRRRSRSPSIGRFSHICNSNDPRDLERRIFVGNLPTSDMEKKDLEEMFKPYGKVVGLSMFRGYGFVQFERPEEAEAAKSGHKGRIYKGYKIDVNMAVERRNPKAQTQASPPRRAPFSSYGDAKDPRPRSRSPVLGIDGRDGREPRDGRDGRGSSREARTSSLSRDHDFRYRGSENRDKDRPDPRDPLYRDDLNRGYRGSADEPYRRKDDSFRESYPEPYGGRREQEEDRLRPEERRRSDLYHQYFEQLQRRRDSERPVDCSVIVVNKAQNREYAETVGRKVRDLGMVVDLIFLNTEVSLTQALEDVGRARTPFAIIITQQHQVHRSCTVNILFGTPQEHRNMPIQDAMMLVDHNYHAYKMENRGKEREELVRKASKMADDVLRREPERELHPVSILTAITLLHDNRFLTPEELDSLIAYLKDKRARLVGSTADPHAASRHIGVPAAAHHNVVSSPPGLPASSMSAHSSSLSSHLSLSAASGAANSSHQQELQAKILSLFGSGSGQQVGTGGGSAAAQSMHYSSMGQSAAPNMQHPSMKGPAAPRAPGYGTPASRMPTAAAGPRPAPASSNINLENPSVQQALDQIIKSGPSLNHLVGTAEPQQASQRPAGSMNQATPMYPRRY